MDKTVSKIIIKRGYSMKVADQAKINQIYDNMSLDEKIASMIVVRACYREAVDTDMVQKFFESGKGVSLGKVFLAGCTKKLEEVVAKLNRLRTGSHFDPFFFIDGEQGLVQMFPFATAFPCQMALGATFDEEAVYASSVAIAKECRALGFSILSQPVLDINTNPDNPIINTRAFGDDPDFVIRMSRAAMRGFEDGGVVATCKHYPGHGDTAVDSHMAMPRVDKDKDTLMEMELKPYKELGPEMTGIMTAHILYPALLGEGEEPCPATLSRAIIYDLARKEFGFKGLMISDSLTMKGIKDAYGIEKAAIGSILAGHDMILQDYNSDPDITFDCVKAAVEDGTIPMEWVEESVKRIISFRLRFGGYGNQKPLDASEVAKVIHCDEHVKLAKDIAYKAITRVAKSAMPLQKSGKTLVIATVSEKDGKYIEDFGLSDASGQGIFYNAVKEYADADFVTMPEMPGPADVDALCAKAKGYDRVVLGSFMTVRAYGGKSSGRLTDEQIEAVARLQKAAGQFILLVFGSPYILSSLDAVDDCLVAYGTSSDLIHGAVDALFGVYEPSGKLPVSVPGRYNFGHSV